MKKNIGTFDQLLRLIAALLLLLFSWWQTSWLLLAFALFCFYEAATSWCIFYQMIGKNSCPLHQSTPSKGIWKWFRDQFF